VGDWGFGSCTGARLEAGMVATNSAPDLWTRLATLDRSCSILVRGTQMPGPGGGVPVRAWEVSIRPRWPRREDPLVVRGLHLLDALAEAAAEAKSRGLYPPPLSPGLPGREG